MDERIIHYFRGELSEKERIALLKDSESDTTLRKELLEYQNAQAIVSLSPENIDKNAGQAGLQRLIKRNRKKRILHNFKVSLGYAAAICAIVAGTWMIALSYTRQELPIAQQQELMVPAGQRARVILPDGSIAWVNAGSTISYPSIFEKERRIQLTGEAYFEVAKNKEKRFIVSTDSLEIEALGTQFNVYSYPEANYRSTILLEGSVKVYRPGFEKEGTILQPNEQLLYANGNFHIDSNIDPDELLWRDGIYSFKKEKLGTIIKKLELYYDVEFIVKDPSILQYEYTGKFRQRDGVLEILRIIQKIHKFKVEKDEDLNRVTLSK